MTTDPEGGATGFQMPCGGTIDPRRPRSAGVLSAAELMFCRENDLALSYDPVQIGWVLATAEDDVYTPATARRAARADATPAAPGPKRTATAPRYTLRAWSENDVAAFVALLDDAQVWTWLPEPYPAPLTPDTALALIDLSNASNHHQVRAVLRDGQIVGQVRLEYDVDPQDPTVAEISYWLGRAHWGRGIGSDIVRLFTARSYADNPGLRSIVARVHDANAASRRILEKAGYVFEGADARTAGWTVLRSRRP